jgi:hypothetical protein
VPALAGAQTPAQTPAPEVRLLAPMVAQQYTSLKRLLTAMADKMPADAYAFRPTPEMRSFAGSVGHLVMANLNQCGNLLGTRHALAGQDLSKSLVARDESLKALADSFAFCDEYFTQLKDDAQLTGSFYDVSIPRNGQRVPTRVAHGAVVTSFLVHNNEMYGYMAVYLRLKGIVPPSSEPRR